MYLSHSTTTAIGNGSASLRSVVGCVRNALIRLACKRGWRAGTSACRPSHERALRIGLGPILQTSRSSSRLFSQACRKSARKATSIDAIVRLLRPRKSRKCLAAATYLSSVPAVNFSRLFLRRASGYLELARFECRLEAEPRICRISCHTERHASFRDVSWEARETMPTWRACGAGGLVAVRCLLSAGAGCRDGRSLTVKRPRGSTLSGLALAGGL